VQAAPAGGVDQVAEETKGVAVGVVTGTEGVVGGRTAAAARAVPHSLGLRTETEVAADRERERERERKREKERERERERKRKRKKGVRHRDNKKPTCTASRCSVYEPYRSRCARTSCMIKSRDGKRA
jgi:hypothetical protein